MDASEFKEFIFGMLFLKRLSDEFDRKREQMRKTDFAHLKDKPDLIKELLEDKTSYGETFFVPVRARWHESWTDENGDIVPALKDLKHDIGNMLNKAIAAIEEENDALAGVLKNNIDFNAVKGKTKIPDPTGGSGGFLIQSHQYVEEQGQDPNDLALYGQDSNGTVWSICNMNMILHNITRFTIENGDTLEDPMILENGQVRKFDRVIANPPFSQNYSRLVDKAEIVEKHDYNLNIRRYVDNTPEPEPEGVQAHLIGGIPEAEVTARAPDFARFGLQPDTLFKPLRPGYLTLNAGIEAKPAIKSTLEANPALQQTLTAHHDALQAWWEVARNDFSQLHHDGKKMPEVRHELLTTLKDKLIPLNVLDEFKSAGVFVNWWQQIRYDLKTIISTGWHHTLIPDDYLIAEFLQSEADEIETLEAQISEVQSELAEAVETAQEAAAYEPEEDETVTAAVIKKALKELIDDLRGSTGDSARKEMQKLQEQEKAIAVIEKRIKDSKVALKTKTDELEHKLKLKRLGGDEFKAESKELIGQVDTQQAKLVSSNKDDKKKITALNKDKATLKERLARTDSILAVIGGQLTEAQARTLILKKLYDLANTELNRYLNAEKRGLIHVVEKLWDKYAVPSRELESERSETLKTLDGFLKGLGYLGQEI